MPRTRRRVRSPSFSVSPTRIAQQLQQPPSAQPATSGFYKDNKRRRLSPSQPEQQQQQPSVDSRSKNESSVESTSVRSSRKRHRTETESRKQSQHFYNTSSRGSSTRPLKRRREKSFDRGSESSDRKSVGRAIIEDDDEGHLVYNNGDVIQDRYKVTPNAQLHKSFSFL